MSFGRGYVSKTEIVVQREEMGRLAGMLPKNVSGVIKELEALQSAKSPKEGRAYIAANEAVLNRAQLVKWSKLLASGGIDRVQDALAELGEFTVTHNTTNVARFDNIGKNGRTYVGAGEAVVSKLAVLDIAAHIQAAGEKSGDKALAGYAETLRTMVGAS